MGKIHKSNVAFNIANTSLSTVQLFSKLIFVNQSRQMCFLEIGRLFTYFAAKRK